MVNLSETSHPCKQQDSLPSDWPSSTISQTSTNIQMAVKKEEIFLLLSWYILQPFTVIEIPRSLRKWLSVAN